MERTRSRLELRLNVSKSSTDEREKVIDRIMEYGTGIENEKALRMYTTPVLEKWADSLESYRASQLKKK